MLEPDLELTKDAVVLIDVEPLAGKVWVWRVLDHVGKSKVKVRK